MSQNQLKPRTPTEALALWIAQNQPELFKQLAARSNQAGQLHGITDWLAGVGSSLGTAVKSVGSFLSSPGGIATIGTLGSAYLQTQQQKNALKVQIAQAQAGYPPQPVYSYGANGATYYQDPVTGQQIPMSSALANQLMPAKSIADYLPWIFGGGALLLAVYSMKR